MTMMHLIRKLTKLDCCTCRCRIHSPSDSTRYRKYRVTVAGLSVAGFLVLSRHSAVSRHTKRERSVRNPDRQDNRSRPLCLRLYSARDMLLIRDSRSLKEVRCRIAKVRCRHRISARLVGIANAVAPEGQIFLLPRSLSRLWMEGDKKRPEKWRTCVLIMTL